MYKVFQRGFVPLILLIALVVVGGGSIVTVKVSQNSLPGEPLYKVKGFIDQVKIQTARTNEAKARTYLDIANERLEEVEKLQAKNAPTDLITRTLEVYQTYNKKALDILGTSNSNQQNQELVKEVKNTAKKKDEVVQKVLEKASEETKDKIQKTAEESKSDTDNFIQKSESKNNSDNQQSATSTPAATAAPTSVPTATPRGATPMPTAKPRSNPTLTPTPTASGDIGLKISDTNTIVLKVAPDTTIGLFNLNSTGATQFEFGGIPDDLNIVWSPQSGTINNGQTISAAIIIKSNAPLGDHSFTAYLKNPTNGKQISIPMVLGVTTKGTISATVYQHGAHEDYPVYNARIRVKNLSGGVVTECKTDISGRCQVEVEGNQSYDVYTLPPSSQSGCGQITRVTVKPVNLVGGGGRIYSEATPCINE